MEDEKTYKIALTFVLDVPDEIYKSDFYTLVLRMNELKDRLHSSMEEYEIEGFNWNI